MKGSKAGLTSVAVINLQHCREWAVVQEPSDDSPEPLYPIDLNKVTRRSTEMSERHGTVDLVEETSNGK
jgi:hypothetical protein